MHPGFFTCRAQFDGEILKQQPADTCQTYQDLKSVSNSNRRGANMAADRSR